MRIGSTYCAAPYRLAIMRKAKIVREPGCASATTAVSIPYRKIPGRDLEEAKRKLGGRTLDLAKALTSEDLVADDSPAKLYMADQLLKFGRRCAGRITRLVLISFRLGGRVGDCVPAT